MDFVVTEPVKPRTWARRFNAEHPPPGWKQGKEPIETALNRLGETMIKDIPVIGIAAVHFFIDQTGMNDLDLAHRLSSFVMNEPVINDIIEIKIRAPPHAPLIVTSDHIKLLDGSPAPVLKGVEITFLEPNAVLWVQLILRQGTARTMGDHYVVVTGFHYQKSKEGDYMFNYELVKGFEDGRYIYKTAEEVLKGRINPVAIMPSDMDDLLIDW